MLINQFNLTVHNGDAVGEQIIALRNLAHEDGYGGELFYALPKRSYSAPAWLFNDYAPYSSPDNVLLLHYGMGYSEAVLEWLRSIPDRKVMVYHNITPPKFFAGISPWYYAGTKLGLQQLGLLRQIAPHAWAASSYNAQDLLEAGWSDVNVLPIIFNRKRYDITPDSATMRRLKDGRPNLLFVGRIAPNKCIKDILLIYYYVRCILPAARLCLIGSAEGLRPYRVYLDALIQRLNLRDVTFAEDVSQAELAAYYRSADAYICMSEHEGFCVPLVESMFYGVPVIAYDAAAVPETLGGCGILVKHKEHAVIAEQIVQLCNDATLRAYIIARQHERVTAFDVEHVRPIWRAALQRVLEVKT